ncbi:MAG: FHA domain-containing protein [Gaiellales bacterium]
MTVLAYTTDETLLGLKVAFLVLLYLFIWLVVRSATRQVVAAPQESMVISAKDAAELRARLTPPTVALTIRSSTVLAPGTTLAVSGEILVGRAAECELRLEGDTTVSSHHARIESRFDGLWVEDEGSTNGTFVNDGPITSPRLLQAGDVIRFGHTEVEVSG